MKVPEGPSRFLFVPFWIFLNLLSWAAHKNFPVLVKKKTLSELSSFHSPIWYFMVQPIASNVEHWFLSWSQFLCIEVNHAFILLNVEGECLKKYKKVRSTVFNLFPGNLWELVRSIPHNRLIIISSYVNQLKDFLYLQTVDVQWLPLHQWIVTGTKNHLTRHSI